MNKRTLELMKSKIDELEARKSGNKIVKSKPMLDSMLDSPNVPNVEDLKKMGPQELKNTIKKIAKDNNISESQLENMAKSIMNGELKM